MSRSGATSEPVPDQPSREGERWTLHLCPKCGRIAKANEDGCCIHCGEWFGGEGTGDKDHTLAIEVARASEAASAPTQLVEQTEAWTLFRSPPCAWEVLQPNAVIPSSPTLEVVEVVPASTLQAAEAERERWTIHYHHGEAGQTVLEGPDLRLQSPVEVVRASTLQAAGAREDALREGLQRIADHDWTQPPDEMPDEMARSLLSTQEGTDG